MAKRGNGEGTIYYSENNLLFCHLNGSIIAPATINIQFKKICKNANNIVDKYHQREYDSTVNPL